MYRQFENYSEDLASIHRHIQNLKNLHKDVGQYNQYVFEEVQKIEDYFWVHKYRDKISGFIYFQYQYKCKYAFISYFVSRRPRITLEMFAKCLFETIDIHHPDCIAVLGEADFPHNQGEALARLKLFCSNHGFYILEGAAYVQPRLSPDAPIEDEIPLVLLYHPIHRKIDNADLAREEYGSILDFIYDGIYGNAFDGNENYAQYLNELKQRVAETSTETIRLTNDADRVFGTQGQ